MPKINKKNKMVLSLLSIGIVILIVVLLPGEEKQSYEPPRTGTRYIPVPTLKPSGIPISTEIPNIILPKDLQ